MLNLAKNPIIQGSLALTITAGGLVYMSSTPTEIGKNCIIYKSITGKDKKLCGDSAATVLNRVKKIRTKEKLAKSSPTSTASLPKKSAQTSAAQIEDCKATKRAGRPIGLMCKIALAMTEAP